MKKKEREVINPSKTGYVGAATMGNISISISIYIYIYIDTCMMYCGGHGELIRT